MLTEYERNRIKEEENIRQKERRKVEKEERQQSTWKETIWPLLNSSFTLFLISVVLLGALEWGFSTIQHSQKVQSDKIEMQRKVIIEIDSRVKETLYALDIVKSDLKKPEGCYSPGWINKVTIELLSGDPKSVNAAVSGGVYSEFDKKSLQGLIREWQRIVDEKDSTGFDQALTQYQTFRERAVNLEDYHETISFKEKKRPASLDEIEVVKTKTNEMKQYLVSKSISRSFFDF
jgi:hypothetical protein